LDRRLSYALGDLFASLVVGVIVGLAAWAIVSPAWNMWAAMFAMMGLGMVVGLALFFPIGIKLGAMEAMIPAMYTGMWSGMVVGMIGAMMPLPMRHAAEIGAACGGAETMFLWIANALLRGSRRPAKAG
jgi:hypothetical protein